MQILPNTHTHTYTTTHTPAAGHKLLAGVVIIGKAAEQQQMWLKLKANLAIAVVAATAAVGGTVGQHVNLSARRALSPAKRLDSEHM